MMKVYSGIKGLVVLLFLAAGLILFFSVFFWGIAKAAELLLPLLTVLAYLLIVVFVLGILPAAYFRNLRPTLAVYAVLMSQLLGVSTWMMAFFFIIKSFGTGALFLALFFQFLAPIALIGAIVKASWPTVMHLSVWLSFTYGMRFYSRWLLSSNSPKREKADIIDVEVVEKGSA